MLVKLYAKLAKNLGNKLKSQQNLLTLKRKNDMTLEK